MRINIEGIVAYREKLEREQRDRELDEGRRLPLYIEDEPKDEKPVDGDKNEFTISFT